MDFKSISRKLYALFILIGVIGALVLFYLYFFVFYTASVTIRANVDAYSVEFFSLASAQKKQVSCSEKICEIADIPPFEYSITFMKEGYETQFLTTKILPRKHQEFSISLDKKATLEKIENTQATETPEQKIQRLRDASKYYASFVLSSGNNLYFEKQGESLELIYEQESTQKKIQKFPLVPEEEIFAEYVSSSSDIFFKIWKKYYIFVSGNSEIQELPFSVDISYIKSGLGIGEYLVVSPQGTFLYKLYENTSEYQYPFSDFIYASGSLIGVIGKNETQKKENFWLEEKNNLLIRYTQETKERKVLLQTEDPITRLEWKEGEIIVTTGKIQYLLKNY